MVMDYKLEYDETDPKSMWDVSGKTVPGCTGKKLLCSRCQSDKRRSRSRQIHSDTAENFLKTARPMMLHIDWNLKPGRPACCHYAPVGARPLHAYEKPTGWMRIFALKIPFIRSVFLFFLIYFFHRSLIARAVPIRSRQQIQTLFASQIPAAAAPKTAPPMNIPIIPK